MSIGERLRMIRKKVAYLPVTLNLDDVVRFKTRVDELSRQGATVVYVTTPRIVVLKNIEMENYFDDGGAWVYAVKSHEHGLKVQGEKIDKKRDQ